MIQTTETRILTPAEVDLEFVRAEGAGYASVEQWRADHARVFAGAAGGFDEDTPIVAERFRLVSASP